MRSCVVSTISKNMSLYLWLVTNVDVKEAVMDQVTAPVRANLPRVSIWSFDD